MPRSFKSRLRVPHRFLRNLELSLRRRRQMREPVGIGQQQRNGRNAAAEACQRRVKRAIGRIRIDRLLRANTGRWLDAFSSRRASPDGRGQS